MSYEDNYFAQNEPRDLRIGFQPEEGRCDPVARWGFPAGANSRPGWVRIPRGIVIPWLLDGQLWQLKVRTNREQPKYLAIGEFDALLLWQEVGDLVEVATLGSCNRGVSITALHYLLGCPRLLVAYDVEIEGEQGAERLAQLSPRVRRIRPPVGKDVTAFWQAGGQVRAWVEFELARLRGVLRG